ncbi:thrombin-like enzyme halystase [Atheta coriaria]|uniref:thrombin-like enzyme halystase n=1 Tax=Dalotia coriaria TaxID=877792 RepID=UPI0031F41EDD
MWVLLLLMSVPCVVSEDLNVNIENLPAVVGELNLSNIKFNKSGILEGEKASITRHPYALRIISVSLEEALMCTGALIDSRYVLTAKHCASPTVRAVSVCLGSRYLPQKNVCNGVRRFARKLVMSNSNDLLIAILGNKVYNTSVTKPLRPQVFQPADIQEACYGVGFDLFIPGREKPKPYMLKVNFTVVHYDDEFIYVRSDKQNVCRRHSGLPLICNEKFVGVATEPPKTDCLSGNAMAKYVNLNSSMYFINKVLSGFYDRSEELTSNWKLILGVAILQTLQLFKKGKNVNKVMVLGLVMGLFLGFMG